MSDAVTKAIQAAMEVTRAQVDVDLVESILDLQRRHQFDESPERRMQEMERLVTDWCDLQAGQSNED